jgi:Flp pilus assembly protein TadG
MGRVQSLHRRERAHFSRSGAVSPHPRERRASPPGQAGIALAGRGRPALHQMLQDARGSALLEFSLALPLLVVFVVGIYDFSGAFNQKQKIEQAAQEGAIVAGAQPMSDIETTNGNPDSLQPVVAVVFDAMAGNGVLTQANAGSCKAASAVITKTGALEWTYAISGCPYILNIIINRGWVPGVPDSTKTVGTILIVKYPYHWQFNSVIQLLFPGASYSPITILSETAAVHNQL